MSELIQIERLMEPVRDMFSAIFFVAIGLTIDPRVLVDYAAPILVITLVVVAGKLVSCGAGAFIAGNDGRTSMRVGMGTGPLTTAPVRLAVSTISRADWSISL